MVAQTGYVTKHHPTWISWSPAMEKMQIVGFTVQETIISVNYIYFTHKLLCDSYNNKTRKSIKVMILVQVICILLDVPFIVLSYLDIFLIKVTIAFFIYAIRVKMKFIVLNDLLDIAKNGIAPRAFGDALTDEENGQKKKVLTSASAPAVVRITKTRRFSTLSSIWQHPNISLKHSFATPQKVLSNTSNKCVVDMLDKKPTPVFPTPPAVPTVTTNSSKMESKMSTSSASTDGISGSRRPKRPANNNLTDIERHYLGQYGIRTVRAP